MLLLSSPIHLFISFWIKQHLLGLARFANSQWYHTAFVPFHWSRTFVYRMSSHNRKLCMAEERHPRTIQTAWNRFTTYLTSCFARLTEELQFMYAVNNEYSNIIRANEPRENAFRNARSLQELRELDQRMAIRKLASETIETRKSFWRKYSDVIP